MPGLCEIAPGRWGPPKIRLVRTGGSRHRRCEVTGGGPHSDKRPTCTARRHRSRGVPAVIDPPRCGWAACWPLIAPLPRADLVPPATVPTATAAATASVATAAAAAAIAAAAAAVEGAHVSLARRCDHGVCVCGCERGERSGAGAGGGVGGGCPAGGVCSHSSLWVRGFVG